VTSAAPHDSTAFDALCDPENTASDLWADSAYRRAEREAAQKEKMIRLHIHHKGHRHKPISKHKQEVNKTALASARPRGARVRASA